jgi:hypothetical protein
LSKTIDSDVQRIAVLLRAADIIWPFEPDKARATFGDAFEVATRNFKEQGARDTNDGRLSVQGIDYRYRVITAIAKRDSVWARKLSKQILDEEAQEAADQAAKDSPQGARTGEKLLGVARQLLASDQSTALSFARNSLGYPAGLSLPGFLQVVGDQPHGSRSFYLEALGAYAKAPMDQFLLVFVSICRAARLAKCPATLITRCPPRLRRTRAGTSLYNHATDPGSRVDSESGRRRRQSAYPKLTRFSWR